jgi:hypothetical protein
MDAMQLVDLLNCCVGTIIYYYYYYYYYYYLVCEAIGHSWPNVPALGDSEDDCGEADGM